MNKTLKVMTSAALLAGVVAPVAVTTVDAASGSITALSVPVISTEDGFGAQNLGVIKVVVPAGAQVAGQELRIALSDGDLPAAATTAVFTTGATIGNGNVVVTVPSDTDNGLSGATLTTNTVTGQDTLKIAFNNSVSTVKDGYFFVKFNNVDLEDVDAGEIKATLTAAPDSGFPTGELVVGKASDNDDVSFAVSSVDSSSDEFGVNLKITEESLGALDAGDEIEFELPAGYVWENDLDFGIASKAGQLTVDNIYGDNLSVGSTNLDDIQFTVDGRKLTLKVNNGTSLLTSLQLKNVGFKVDDEDKAKVGDIVATIDTDGVDGNVSEAVVGKYGEFGTSVDGDAEVPTILAGKNEQKIGKVVIKEDLESTLVEGRKISLKLPDGAKFIDAKSTISDESATLSLDDAISLANPKDTIRYTVDDASDDPASLEIKDLEVAVEAGFEGDLFVEVAGTAGVTGKILVAKVIAPVATKATTELPNVIIGKGAQTAADFTITESVKEAFEDNAGKVELDLPEGIYFSKLPTVTVEDQNGKELEIENVKLTSENNIVEFNIDTESSAASVIKVSDVKLDVYRSVPEGKITLEIKGGDLVETDGDNYFGGSDTAATVEIAQVSTPAPTETKGAAKFTIGSTTYTVNGVEKVADVAPFIEAGRTYLPVRYAAEATGVAGDNILWDNTTRTVTLLNGDRVAQMTIGSNVLKVNGASIAMDAQAKIVDGRTVLPIKFVAQALGQSVEWNQADQTVTVE